MAAQSQSAQTVTTKDSLTVTLERRPTVDRNWVVHTSDGETMIELHVVEKNEDREKIFADTAKKHGGAATKRGT